jgi:hypothetical protein
MSGGGTAALLSRRDYVIQLSVVPQRGTTLGGESRTQSTLKGVDLSRLGSGERNSANPKAREGRASGRERVHPSAQNGDATRVEVGKYFWNG